MSLSTLANVWYITSTLPCCRITKPNRSPSGTLTVLMKPRCSIQSGSTGSIFSTNNIGVSFFAAIGFSLRRPLVSIRLVQAFCHCQGVAMKNPQRQLKDLISIGPAMLRDFELLGIRSVEQLAKQDPVRMYKRMERATGQRQDPCVLDTFCAAVAQARNPRLAAEKCQWWWWSRERKRR